MKGEEMNDVENGMLDYSEFGSYEDDWLGGWGRHGDNEPFAIYDPD